MRSGNLKSWKAGDLENRGAVEGAAGKPDTSPVLSGAGQIGTAPSSRFPYTGTSFYRDHFIPAHSFYRFSLQGDTLRVWPLNPDWVKSAIENNEVAGEFKTLPDDTLFLASPPRELQQMVVDAVGRPDTFGDALILVRKN